MILAIIPVKGATALALRTVLYANPVIIGH